MRIGLNLRSRPSTQVLETYFLRLLEPLGRRGVEFLIFIGEEVASDFAGIANTRLSVASEDERSDIQAAGRQQLDVFWSGSYLDPLFVDLPSVVTIPDLRHEHSPHLYEPNQLAWRRRCATLSVRTAQAILTFSRYSAATIVEALPEARGKVFSSSPGLSPEFLDKASMAEGRVQEVRARYGLTGEYLLFDAEGSNQDEDLLIHALREASARIPGAPILVLSERDEVLCARFKEASHEHQPESGVLFRSNVERQDLPAIYAGARAVAYPWLGDGFPIPVLQAMAAGTPIVAADGGIAVEVAGQAALHFDRFDPGDLVRKLEGVTLNPGLRQRLSVAARQRAREFSWETAADRALKALTHAVRDAGLEKHYIPLVSVVTPSLNQAHYLERALGSVQEQEYPRIEHLVRDGGSDDGSLAILAHHSDTVRWTSEPDSGQADAVNIGVRESRGEIIGWLNSDDIYFPKAAAIAVEEFLLDPELDVVYGDALLVGASGEPLGTYPTLDYDPERWVDWCFICQPAAFIRRSAWERVGGLDEGLRFSMDYDLWLRLAAAGAKFRRYSGLLAGSRMYPAAKTLSSRRGVHEESLAVVRKHTGKISHQWLLGLAEFCLNGSDGFFQRPQYTENVHRLAELLEKAFRDGSVADLWPLGVKFGQAASKGSD